MGLPGLRYRGLTFMLHDFLAMLGEIIGSLPGKGIRFLRSSDELRFGWPQFGLGFNQHAATGWNVGACDLFFAIQHCLVYLFLLIS